MTVGSQEHYDIVEQFEKYCAKYMRCRLDRNPREDWSGPAGVFESGETQELFKLYSAGYANGRCVYMA